MTTIEENSTHPPIGEKLDTHPEEYFENEQVTRDQRPYEDDETASPDQGTSDHFSKDDWKNLADIDPKAKKTISMLSSIDVDEKNNLIFPDSSQIDKSKIVGNLYDHARNDTTPKPEKGKKAQNKVALIRLTNGLKLVKKNIEAVDLFFVSQRSNWNFCRTPPNAHESYEMRGHFLLRALQYTLTNYSDSFEEKAYELLIIVNKFLNIIQKINDFSPLLKGELHTENSALRTHIHFDSIKILNKFPKLTVVNNFENILPGKQTLKFMQHQKDILNIIMNNLSDGFLLRYVIMAGYGKTTTAVPLGKIIQILNQRQKSKDKPFKLVFACNIDPVRLEVAKMLFHEGVSFGNIAQKYWLKDSNEWYIRRHPSFLRPDKKLDLTEDEKLLWNIKNSTSLITGPEYAQDVIKVLEENGYNVILFLDEPTVGADTPNSSALKMNSSLMANLPKRTILSSATFPDIQTVQCICDSYNERFPHGNSNLDPISICDVKIGCEVFTYNQAHFPVFSGISDAGELENASSTIQRNGFVRRMCNLASKQKMESRMSRCDLEPLDSERWSNDLDNLTPDRISGRLAEQMLSLSLTGTGEQIKKICKLKAGNSDHMIDFKNLLSDHTLMMDGMTLIATQNPESFVDNNFGDFLENLKKTYNVEKALATYDKEVAIYDKAMEEKEKAEESMRKKSTKVGSNGKVVDIHQSGGTEKFDKMKYPTFHFPEKFQVNSVHHCNHTKSTDPKLECRHESHQTNFPYGVDVSNDDKYRLAELYTFAKEKNINKNLILLLLSGIGICSKNIKNEYYKDLVFSYASRGYLSFVISDDTICFGTSYPFTRVFIGEDFARVHSIETINQVVARGGRMGLAYKCYAYFPSTMASRLHDFIQFGKDTQFSEGANIAHGVMTVIHERTSKKFELFKNKVTTIFDSYLEDMKELFDESCNLLNPSEEDSEEDSGEDSEEEHYSDQISESNFSSSESILDDWEDFLGQCQEETKEAENNADEEKPVKNDDWRKNEESSAKQTKVQLDDENIVAQGNWRNSMMGTSTQQPSQQPKSNKYVPPSQRK